MSSRVTACPQCGGVGEERVVMQGLMGRMVSVQPCRRCGGEGQTIDRPCPRCNGDGRRRSKKEVTVEVPAGVSSENYITLRGEGNVGPRGGPRGDILVLLDVEEERLVQALTELTSQHGGDVGRRVQKLVGRAFGELHEGLGEEPDDDRQRGKPRDGQQKRPERGPVERAKFGLSPLGMRLPECLSPDLRHGKSGTKCTRHHRQPDSHGNQFWLGIQSFG